MPTMISGVCAICDTPFTRQAHRPGRERGLLCSRRCAAALASRRHSEAARARGSQPACETCAGCGGRRHYNSPLCRDCSRKHRQESVTLADLRKGRSAFEFHAKLRGLARSAYRGKKECAVCGYTLHVDICHIRPVADFPAEATLGQVNHPDNLVAFDKRCHWEFDHGYIRRECGLWLRMVR